MSCYNSERGTIKIPSAEIVSLRKTIVKSYNKRQKALREKFNRNIELMRKMLLQGKDYWEVARQCNLGERGQYLLRKRWDKEKKYLKKCRLKDIDLKKVSAQQVTLSEKELYVTIDTDRRVLIWNIEENNRAVESAHDTDLSSDVMRALNRVNWCRDSGGVIKYQDEYQRDAYQGPSVSHRFGPNGKIRF